MKKFVKWIIIIVAIIISIIFIIASWGSATPGVAGAWSAFLAAEWTFAGFTVTAVGLVKLVIFAGISLVSLAYNMQSPEVQDSAVSSYNLDTTGDLTTVKGKMADQGDDYYIDPESGVLVSTKTPRERQESIDVQKDVKRSKNWWPIIVGLSVGLIILNL